MSWFSYQPGTIGMNMDDTFQKHLDKIHDRFLDLHAVNPAKTEATLEKLTAKFKAAVAKLELVQTKEEQKAICEEAYGALVRALTGK